MTVKSEFSKFFNPVLNALRELGNSGRPKEVCRLIANTLQLSEEELDRTLKDGTSRFEDQVAWARFYLVRTEYLDGSTRGVWRLTDKGKAAVLSDADIRDIVRKVDKRYGAKRDTKGQRGKSDEELVSPSDARGVTDDHRSVLTETLRALPPAGFENFCKRVLREAGFQEVVVTGQAGDGGIDGHGILQINPLLSVKVLFQCKRYRDAVGAGQVREFQGAMVGRADKGILITTGTFTSGAQREAARDGAVQIELIDLNRLIDLIENLELGVSKETVYVVDQDFFDDFRVSDA